MTIGVKHARSWAEWEGHLVDGKFRLVKCLRITERSAVFHTERSNDGPRKAAIKLIALDERGAQAQLARWKASALLVHPHLMRMFENGRVQLGDLSCAYVVMEYAEEDLSQVDRPLTVAEASDMLGTALNILTYLENKGFAHGHLKPSNFMAVGDQLKISSDTIRPIGEWSSNLDVPSQSDPPEITEQGASSAGDIWSLGFSLLNAQKIDSTSLETGADASSLGNLPAPFRVIISGCLRRDPKQRWTVPDLAAFLERNAETPRRPSPDTPSYANRLSRRYVLAAGVIGIAVAATVIAPRIIGHRSASEPPALASAISQNEPTAKQSQSEASVAKTSFEGTRGVVRQDILKKVLPDVPAQARNTIRGKINIRIRVKVDASGSVTNAMSESKGSSRFFGNLAMQAAQQWKFAPESSNEWILRFQFVRDPNNSVSVQATPSK